MKANKWGVWIVLLLTFTSCGGYYKMTSRINRDGSMVREVYASGDSAFMAGNHKRQPFLFRIDSGWELTKLNPAISVNFWGEEHSMNVKVSRHLPVVGKECFQTLEGKEFMRPLVVPKETLNKKFRWFYTYYTFEAIYSEMSTKGPVPLSRYMNAEEQQLWFRGERTAFEGWSGMEMKNILDELDRKFWNWFTRSQYEVSWEILCHFESLQQRDTTSLSRLKESKENVFKTMSGKEGLGDLDRGTPESVCNYYDKFGGTSHYSELYKANKEAIDAMFEQKAQITELAGYVIRYELSMPGELLVTNAPSQIEGMLAWRVDVMRLLESDYQLTAESRVPNYWAFGVTFLFIVVAVWGCWKMRRN